MKLLPLSGPLLLCYIKDIFLTHANVGVWVKEPKNRPRRTPRTYGVKVAQRH